MLFFFWLALAFAEAPAPEILGEVTVFKYWHLASTTDTTHIQKAKSLPQFKNQYKVYTHILGLLKKASDIKTLITEGCQGEIDQNFTGRFNGWSYQTLEKLVGQKNYDQIMTLVPLKLKARYPQKLQVICGDKAQLIKQTDEAFFELEKRLQDSTSKSPTASESRQRAVALISQIKSLIEQRNHYFLQVVKEHAAKNPMVVIGSARLQGLAKLLYAEKNLAFKVIETPGYPQDEGDPLDKLLHLLQSHSSEL